MGQYILQLPNLFTENDCWGKYFFSRRDTDKRKAVNAAQIFNKVRIYRHHHKINKFDFSDTVNTDPVVLEKFCAMVIKNGLEIEWTAPLTVKRDMDEGMFRDMKSAGCRKVFFRISGVSDAFLKRIDSGLTASDISRALRLSCEAGIDTGVKLLFGYPAETQGEFSDTIAFLRRNSAFIKEIRLDYCISNYPRWHFFPGKISSCSSWQRCRGLANETSQAIAINMDKQIAQIESLGIPVTPASGLKAFKEIISRYVSPYALTHGPITLFADTASKSLRLFYRDRELTRQRGLHSCFFFEGVWFDTSSAKWEAEKEKDSLIIRLYWEKADLAQVWRVGFRNNALFLQLDSRMKSKPGIREFKFGVMLTAEYKTFFCGHQEEAFVQEFDAYWHDLPLDEPRAALFGTRKQQELPAVVMERAEGQSFPAVIQNSDMLSGCRVLQLCLSEEECSKPAFSFLARIGVLDEEGQISGYIAEKKAQFLASNTIHSAGRDLAVSFNYGACNIFWKELRLTRGLALYTSLLSQGVWHDSKHAEWETRKINGQKMVLKGRWHTLPIIQLWEIESKKGNIHWKVEIEILEEMGIEGEQQANVMLSDEYVYWSAEDGSWGIFPTLFNNEWATLFDRNSAPAGSVSVKSADSRLPAVRFRCSQKEGALSLGVLNTSSSFCARKLKCYRIEEPGKRYYPGRYPYFEGEIEIIP